MSNKITTQLRSVASRLAGKSDLHSVKIFRLAQAMEDGERLYNDFDPSQEGASLEPKDNGFAVNNPEEQLGEPGLGETGEQVQPFAAEESGGTEDTSIPIESFIRNDQEPATPSNFDTHTCTVIFSAPKDTQESDMMNYILGIGKELGVEVKKFEWEKMDPKPVKTTR